MYRRWLQRLQAGEWLLLDGGTTSELRRRGVPLRSDVWSGLAPLSHGDELCAVHADYIAAGADVITTSTFATSRFVLDAAGFGDRFVEINRRAVEAARRARDASGAEVAIAGSISCLPPAFDTAAYPSPAAESAAYRELAEQLAELGVDVLLLEMMEDAEHAARACEAAVASGLPFWLGVSCRFAADGRALAAYDFPAVRFDAVLDALLPFEPAVVCVMHSPADAIEAALDAIQQRWPGYVGAYPEWPLGEPEQESSATLVRYARRWRERGAAVLGGCCGTTPAHIRALRAHVG